MKVCTKCKTNKPLSDFYKQSDRESGSSYCKSCKNKYDTIRWIQKKLDAIEYKGGECSACGYSKYYGALQFHHLNPSEKDVDWSKLRLRTWPKIKHELDKCELLCANCHAEAHAKDNDLWCKG